MALGYLEVKNAKAGLKPIPNSKLFQTVNSDYKLSDGGGLYLLVTKSGGKLWKYKYRFEGKEKKLSLGSFPNVSISEARERHALAKKLLANGIDPNLQKKLDKYKRADDAELTFERVAKEWADIKSETLASSTHKKLQQTLSANVYPYLGKFPISTIVYEQIREVIQIMQNRGAVEYSMKTREWIAGVFNHAVNEGYIQNNPVRAVDDKLKKPKHTKYPHLKSLEDAGKFLRGVVDYGGSFEVKAFAFIMLNVAQRPTELRCAKWSEFDFARKTWTVKVTKTEAHLSGKIKHIIMLSKQVINLLQDLQKFSGNGEYLFASSRVGRKPISEATGRNVFRECFPDYHHVPHGSRHLFTTEANAAVKVNRMLKFDADVIEATLSHADKNEIRGTYNNAQYLDAKFELAQWWSDQLEIAQFGAKVLTFAAKSGI